MRKRFAAFLTVLVTLTFVAVLPSSAARAFERLHAGMEHEMPCHTGDCLPAAASCAAHCFSTATMETSVPVVLPLTIFFVALSILAFVFVPQNERRFIPVGCGPPGRFEKRLLRIMKRE